MERLSRLLNQTELYVSQHEICECYVHDDINCVPDSERSPFLTCDRLLSDRVFSVYDVVYWPQCNRWKFILCWDKEKQKLTRTNFKPFCLAIWQCLTYLWAYTCYSLHVLISIFGEYFPIQAEVWRSGITCRIAGTISIISSEASVFFVTLISIDRSISIKYHYSCR